MSDPRQVAAEGVAAVNAHDEKRLRATYADDAVLEAPGPLRLEGGDAATEHAMVWLRAFPDARMVVENELVAGDWVVLEFTFTGTHTGTLASLEAEIPPTNRRATGRCVDLVRVEGGKIVEEHMYFDQVELLTQLGLMPETATA